MNETSDKRREARLPRRDAIHIQILAADLAGAGPAQVVHCRTEDVSATGFRVCTEGAILAGTILDLLIEVDGDPRRYLLIAEARWCRPEGEGHAVGFELLEAEHSDIGPWRALFPTE